MGWTTFSIVLLTSVVLCSTVFMSCVLSSVLTVFTLAGSSVAFACGYTFPTAMWIKIHRRVAPTWKLVTAITLCGLSCIFIVVCTYKAFAELGHPACPSPTRTPAHVWQTGDTDALR